MERQAKPEASDRSGGSSGWQDVAVAGIRAITVFQSRLLHF